MPPCGIVKGEIRIKECRWCNCKYAILCVCVYLLVCIFVLCVFALIYLSYNPQQSGEHYLSKHYYWVCPLDNSENIVFCVSCSSCSGSDGGAQPAAAAGATTGDNTSYIPCWQLWGHLSTTSQWDYSSGQVQEQEDWAAHHPGQSRGTSRQWILHSG